MKPNSDDRLVRLFDDYNRSGITGVIDRNCSDGARSAIRTIAEIEPTYRCECACHEASAPARIWRRYNSSRQHCGGSVSSPAPHPRLGVIGVKVFQDGGMLTGSAYFRTPLGSKPDLWHRGSALSRHAVH